MAADSLAHLDWCQRETFNIDAIDQIDCLRDWHELDRIYDLWDIYNTVADMEWAAGDIDYSWCNRNTVNILASVPNVDCLTEV